MNLIAFLLRWFTIALCLGSFAYLGLLLAIMAQRIERFAGAFVPMLLVFILVAPGLLRTAWCAFRRRYDVVCEGLAGLVAFVVFVALILVPQGFHWTDRWLSFEAPGPVKWLVAMLVGLVLPLLASAWVAKKLEAILLCLLRIPKSADAKG